MDLPVRPPVRPMLAKLSRRLPTGAYLYEPKWDGFRCLVFRDGRDVHLQSRHGNPLARYFPELVEAFASLAGEPFVIDGEIVLFVDGRADFPALMARLHPAASRVERLRRETPASFVAFDLLALGDVSLMERPYIERRRELESVFADARPPLLLTPVTDDPEIAAGWLERYRGGGIDGVVAKAADAPYEPGKRAMVKVKRELTADVVVAGFRWQSERPVLGSLLLGLYDRGGRLKHVGVVTSFTAAMRKAVLAELEPLVVPLEGHPWEHGFGLERSPLGRLLGAAGRWSPEEMTMDWVPVRPDLVCEVAYDHVEVDRFRHPARFRRWRPDRDPRSCTFEQLEEPSADPAGAVPAAR